MLELRGKKVSDGIKKYVSKELETLSFVPKLAIVRVGDSITRPWSRQMITSELRTVDRRCAMTKVVRPVMRASMPR